jgi:LacI family transcriptional regulator
MSIKIGDVSQAAGVSIKTVSRVLNNEKYVSKDTRERVEAAVAKLGYHPNSAARALAGDRSFQIALIYDNPSPYNAQNVQAGVKARCIEGGYRMISQPSDADSTTLLNELCGLIDQAMLDGIILTPPFTDNQAIRAELARRDISYVTLSPATLDNAVAAAFIDNVQAAEDMTTYLVSLGHRRIGFVEGDTRYAASAQRLAGYRKALDKAGLDYDATLVRPGQFDFESGSAAAADLLALKNPPTAIFASNDEMAAGVLATAHRLRVSVPSELSVAGFDDTDLAQVVWPPLTTVRQPVRALGYAAADLLFQLPDKVEQRLLPHELIVRDSSAANGVPIRHCGQGVGETIKDMKPFP